jgi:GNAT superfamily N-acetyltransferase
MAHSFEIRPLSSETWPGFARINEKHGGVWGGCWCMSFHDRGFPKRTAEENRARKEQRVRAGEAHAALVYSGTDVVGWCQFGPPEELPRIKHKREYDSAATQPPDWRITCFFTDRDWRHKGVAETALAGALDEIARLGGGRVESYPQDTENKRISNSFLHNGTVPMFTRAGFSPIRRLGKSHWVVARAVDSAG